MIHLFVGVFHGVVNLFQVADLLAEEGFLLSVLTNPSSSLSLHCESSSAV